MQTYFIEGIILKHKNFREVDRLITIYTKQYGKLELLSKGSRKIKSKLAGSLEPFFYVKMQIAKGKKIDVITSSEVIKNNKNLASNLEKIALASFIFEVLDNATKVYQKDEKTFQLLIETMGIIDQAREIEKIKSKIIWFFVWRTLDLAGFKPEFDKCLKCKKDFDTEKYFFDYKNGGIICLNCQNKVKNKIAVTSKLINIMKLIYKEDFTHLEDLHIENKISQHFSKITFLFLKYHLEKELKSEKFLKIFKDSQ